MIELKYCTLRRDGPNTVTTFHDGSSCVAVPSEHPWHKEIASWVGCAGQMERYTFEHEFTHSFLSQVMWDAPSYVVWMEAHGRKMSEVGARFEERWCFHFHRFLNDMGPALEPEWPGWEKAAIELLGRA